ncbi:hypothetical protein PXK00_17025 [Phaeobacter sp. QD34_3]|uniref:hypothetical protein n=1 Tax=unclassified Phaeobacter TaxID=2621772 RepID=UPI00237FB162|nr:MULTISPECIES: hypothetical protein [unclassified Phaeobacter]MDE4134817.1 hypothetical protein [Phaeobacter sp. QD34_3]MDE4138475.1 hypothetical protein [Phaeobacter sp. QD34_24]
MDTTPNRLGGAMGAGETPVLNFNLEKNISGAKHDLIDKDMVFSMIQWMADELNSEKDAPELVRCLLGMANELVQTLEHHELIHITPADTNGIGSATEAPMLPPRIPPLPSLAQLHRLPREDQARFLDKRASDLMREIEGLRLGYYEAPDYRLDYRMIEQARRRYRKLRDTAMKLGHWTDGRWEAGSEETHLV